MERARRMHKEGDQKREEKKTGKFKKKNYSTLVRRKRAVTQNTEKTNKRLLYKRMSKLPINTLLWTLIRV